MSKIPAKEEIRIPKCGCRHMEGVESVFLRQDIPSEIFLSQGENTLADWDTRWSDLLNSPFKVVPEWRRRIGHLGQYDLRGQNDPIILFGVDKELLRNHPQVWAVLPNRKAPNGCVEIESIGMASGSLSWARA